MWDTSMGGWLFSRPRWRRFAIPKRNGKLRVIHDPGKSHRSEMSEIARSVARSRLSALISTHEYGFVPGLGFQHAIQRVAWALERARRNRESQASIVTVDLKDYFPSISEKRARRAAEKLFGTRALGSLASHNGKLCQGHPLAPILANVAARVAKQAIVNAAERLGGYPTWYADDLTVVLDSLEKAKALMDKIRKTLRAQGLKIAENKVRIRRLYSLGVFPLNILGGSIRLTENGVTVRLTRRQRRRARALTYITSSYEDAPATIRFQLMGLATLASDLWNITRAIRPGRPYNGKFVGDSH